MTVYVDTSALARAYFGDEPEHHRLYARLFESRESVVTASLAVVELARAVNAKRRSGRPVDLDAIADHCWLNVSTLALEETRHLPAARDLVLRHPLGTLDAVHVAVALEVQAEVGPPLTFLTRDPAQARAAAAEGLAVE